MSLRHAQGQHAADHGLWRCLGVHLRLLVCWRPGTLEGLAGPQPARAIRPILHIWRLPRAAAALNLSANPRQSARVPFHCAAHARHAARYRLSHLRFSAEWRRRGQASARARPQRRFGIEKRWAAAW